MSLIGTCIAGKYQVTHLVSETELSAVYRATHVLWKRPVAVKVFKAPSASEEAREELLASFVREGALLAELSESCSAICQARDVGSLTMSDGTWIVYTVLEWLEGESLEVVLSRERAQGAPPRTIHEVLDLLAPIADALSVAHARGVCHCDVKPANVMLVAKGVPRAKLLDFGVAKTARPEDARAHGRAFTPAFGAPEQFDPALGATGPWTDVFALALVIIELLTGREALRGDTLVALAQQACDPARRPTPLALGARVSTAVDAVLARALEVDATRRYKDAGELWDALRRAAASGARVREPTLPFALNRRRITPMPPPPPPKTAAPFPLALCVMALALAILPGIGQLAPSDPDAGALSQATAPR